MKFGAINNDIPVQQIKEDLQRFAKLAVDLGATHVESIDAKEVVIDYRVRFKCQVPKCHYYNTNAHCPPYAPSFEEMKKLLSCYSCALLVGLRVPSGVITTGAVQAEQAVNKPSAASRRNAARRKLTRIIVELESEAFYGGYYFAAGFSSGSCKGTWCKNMPCQALEKGKGCRFPLKSRPSMEAVGMDVFKMATNAGWPIYPVGSRCPKDNIPYGMMVGIILIT